VARSPISGVFKVVDKTADVLKGIDLLVSTQVMVGVPSEKAGRREGEITNADLAYIHDKGAPNAKIPARPFMEPGINDAKAQIIDEMMKAGRAILRQGSKNVENSLNRIGLIATRAIKNRITEGIPPPLAPSTVQGRITRVKSKSRRAKIRAELASGTPASRQGGADGLFTPLIVTGQLRNAITYVLRRVKRK
jgi:hypothetical protein